MLTPNYMENVSKIILGYYLDLEEVILFNIGKNLIEAAEMGENENLKHTEILIRQGYALKTLNKALRKTNSITLKEVEKLVFGAAKQSYKNDEYIYSLGKKELQEFDHNSKIKQLISVYTKQCMYDFNNLTNTLGLEGKPIKQYYQSELNKAVTKIQNGGTSRDKALNQVINNLASKGLESIDYSSGRSYSVEAAVRTAVNTTLNQLTGKMSEYNADDMDQDLMEITAHSGARPSHQEWQGKIVDRTGRNSKYLTLDDIGYQTAEGFMGVNCRHHWYPYFEGISIPAWTKGNLETIDNEPFDYKGKTYTEYQATQKQRYYERQIRKQKRKLKLIETSSNNDWKLQEKKRLRDQQKKYREFSKAANLKRKMDRTQIAK